MNRRTRQRGMTIIELLIVLVIIGILAGFIVQSVQQARRRARDATVIYLVSQLRSEAAQYLAENDTLGTSCIVESVTEGDYSETEPNFCDDYLGTTFKGIMSDGDPDIEDPDLYPSCGSSGNNDIAFQIKSHTGRLPECLSHNEMFRILSARHISSQNYHWCVDSNGFAGFVNGASPTNTEGEIEKILDCTYYNPVDGD